MQSSNNVYLTNLDHLRTFAAYTVFCWHFLHHNVECANLCYSTIYTGATNLPFFTLLEQGHTGVALFLCISGYIFTRLAHGKKLNLVGFWQNRLLRLFPLIIAIGLATIAVRLALGGEASSWHDVKHYGRMLLHTGGTWTVYMELRYYALFPILLFAMRKLKPLPVIAALLAFTLAYRGYHWNAKGSVQFMAYHRLAGRADQFLLGGAAFYIEQWLMIHRPDAKRVIQVMGMAGLIVLLTVYYAFSLQGGLYLEPNENSPSPLWIFIPLIEGACYSAIIIAYLTLKVPRRLDIALAATGRWSYSFYLVHFLLIPPIFWALSLVGFMPNDFYWRLAVGTFVVFPLIMALSACSYQLVEKPFLRLRRPYLQPLTTKTP